MFSDLYWDYWFKTIHLRRDDAEITGMIDLKVAEKRMATCSLRILECLGVLVGYLNKDF